MQEGGPDRLRGEQRIGPMAGENRGRDCAVAQLFVSGVQAGVYPCAHAVSPRYLLLGRGLSWPENDAGQVG
ncbi:hypothetical protein D3C84_1137400 [compost metagenome]